MHRDRRRYGAAAARFACAYVAEADPDAGGRESAAMTYCCAMRSKFILAIVGDRKEVPYPVDVVDFQDFDNALPDGTPVLRIRFCPFCGKPPGNELRTTHNPLDL